MFRGVGRGAAAFSGWRGFAAVLGQRSDLLGCGADLGSAVCVQAVVRVPANRGVGSAKGRCVLAVG